MISLLAWLGFAPAAVAADPAVARPSIRVDTETIQSGLVFFLRAPGSSVGTVAVGTAHSFDLQQLTTVTRMEFHTGRSRRLVASSAAFLISPGRPFNAPGASLADDFSVYALDATPSGIHILEAEATKPAEVKQRVRILGVPNDSYRDENNIFGRVSAVGPTRIEVELDLPGDLRNWGGAPVLSTPGDRVIGMLQAYFPQDGRSIVHITPIGVVTEAMERPFEGGVGRPFGEFEDRARSLARAPRRKIESTDPEIDGKRIPAPPPGPLIRQGPIDETRVHLEIDYPAPGTVFGRSACGGFVSGRAMALQGELRAFDVVLVLDTSQSTSAPSGADINGDGEISTAYMGSFGSILGAGARDSGDSILAAEVAAARQLMHGLDPRTTRVAVVTFAGDAGGGGNSLFSSAPPPPAVTLQRLTNDYRRIKLSLDEILATEPRGATHMAAGIDRAMIELVGLRGSLSEPDPRSEKVILFFTDGQPTLPYGIEFKRGNVLAVLRATARAQRAHIRIHSFAIGPEALEGPIAAVEMAARTDGYFTPVMHPGDLVDIVEQVSFANLKSIVVRSLTTGEPADPFRPTADGSWSGFIRLEPGENEIEVYAQAVDGVETRKIIRVGYEPEAPGTKVPQELAVLRNRLLEDCLRGIKRIRMTTEEERAEQVRRQLLLDIDRQRTKARERAAEQRKRLDLEIEEE